MYWCSYRKVYITSYQLKKQSQENSLKPPQEIRGKVKPIQKSNFRDIFFAQKKLLLNIKG